MIGPSLRTKAPNPLSPLSARSEAGSCPSGSLATRTWTTPIGDSPHEPHRRLATRCIAVEGDKWWVVVETEHSVELSSRQLPSRLGDWTVSVSLVAPPGDDGDGHSVEGPLNDDHPPMGIFRGQRGRCEQCNFAPASSFKDSRADEGERAVANPPTSHASRKGTGADGGGRRSGRRVTERSPPSPRARRSNVLCRETSPPSGRRRAGPGLFGCTSGHQPIDGDPTPAPEMAGG
jgi:hypothetical protein